MTDTLYQKVLLLYKKRLHENFTTPHCVSKQATFLYDYENFYCHVLSVVSNQYIGEGQNAILL
jgi:hypothetical protein